MKYSIVLSAFILYAVIQFVIRFAYRNAPGSPFWFMPMANVRAHAERPIATLITLAVIAVLLYLAFCNWSRKPYLLRLSFVLLAPAFIILYLLCGQAFEFRVFGELYPVAALLAWKGVS